MTEPTPLPPHVPPPGSPPPSEPPQQPTGPGRTQRELEILQARYDAAIDYIHVTDHARELRKVGRLTDIDRAEVAFIDLDRIEHNPSGDRS